MNRYQSAHQKRNSRRQEKQVAKDLGGRVEAASGATKFGGGDVRGNGYRIECKCTAKDFYVLRYEDCKKIKAHAFKALEQPVFQLQFLSASRIIGEYAIVRSPVVGPMHAKKTCKLTLAQIQRELAEGVQFGVRFEEEVGTWRVISWLDFCQQVKEDQEAT